MAEKGFGVKEVNLIGASGTPTITSPNNLNLNAVNVAISTNATVGGTLSVTGNVSIGGTLTYEDVTNIDSVGMITARTDITLGSSIIHLGDTDTKIEFATDTITFETAGIERLQIDSNGKSDVKGNLEVNNGSGSGIIDFGDTDNAAYGRLYADSNGTYIGSKSNQNLILRTNNVARVNINTDGHLYPQTDSTYDLGLTGTRFRNAYVDTYYGDGSNLTGITIAPTNSDIQVVYTVTANGSSAYRFAGNGVVSTADNPDLYLMRGQKYRFINNSGGSHPFQIREASGGTAYSTGVTNNGAASGNIDFAPTYDSPAQLVYQCTSHGGMVGNIYLRDAAGNNTNVGVTTFSSVVNVSGNTNLSSELRANGNIRITNAGPKISLIDSNNDDDFEIKNNDGVFTVRDATNSADRLLIDSSGQATFDKGAPASSNQVISRFQAESSRKLDIVWHDSGSLMGFDTPGNHSYIFKVNGTERARLTGTDATISGATDGVLNLTTSDSRGSFIRFQQAGTSKAWVGCGQGLSLGDVDDLGLRATDKIRFMPAGTQTLILDGAQLRHGSSNVLAGGLDDVRIRNSSSYKGFVLRGTGGSGGMANYDEYCFLFNRMGSDGNIITFNAQGSQEGSISVSGSSVAYNGGVLTRWSQLVGISTDNKANRPTIYQGTVMSNLDEMCEWPGEENMQLNKTEVSTTSGDKNVAGVFWAWDDDDDTYVNDFYVAQTGDYIIRVGAATTITRGDLLESAGDGTAKPQSDDIVRSKTVAKVTSGIAHTTYPDGTKTYPCVLMGS